VRESFELRLALESPAGEKKLVLESLNRVQGMEKNNLHGTSAEYSVGICDSTFSASCCTSPSACRCCTRSFYVTVKALDDIPSTRLFKILRL